MDQRAEKFLLEVSDGCNDPLAVFDLEYRISKVNRAMSALFKLPHEELIGRHCHAVFFGREEPCEGCHAKEVFTSGEPCTQRVEMSPPGGAAQSFDALCYPIMDSEGRTIRVIQHMRGVAVPGRTLESFRQDEETVRALLGVYREPSMLLNSSGDIIAINEVGAQWLGSSVEDVVGKSLFDLLPPEVGEFGRARFSRVLRNGKQLDFEEEHRGRFYLYNIHPVFDAEGRVTRAAFFCRDVTRHRQREKARAQLEALIEVPKQASKKSSLKEFVEFIHDLTAQMYPASDAVFLLLDAESKGFLSLDGCLREVREPLADVLEKLGEGELCQEFIQHLSSLRESRVIDSLSRHDIPRFLKEAVEGYPTWLGLPIITQQNCIGFFILGLKRSEDLPADDQKFFSTLFSQVAGTLRHLVFYDAEADKAGTARTARSSYEEIIGRSGTMQEVYELIDLVSKSEATVLITGENGTGKELVAQAIHNKSERCKGPFVVANCSAYSPTLLESELFGHEKGAFTGAIRQKKGRIERANGGTLFLDEIGDIAPATQVLLLRFLQDHIFERVGGESTIKADVRVLAATNRNLYKEVDAGKFREDLYYRLNVITIHLPRLSERREDIPLLSKHFLEQFNEKEGKEIKRFSSNAIKELMRYGWPGNVRQLENAISHAVIMTKGSVITRKQLPRFLQETMEESTTTSLSENERRLILKVLEESNWNKHEAARRLKVSRSTLYSKIRRYGLEERRKSV